jgi:hypothetical protein
MPRFRSDPSRVRRGASQGAFLLALFGFVIALVTAGYVVYRDPPWGRLGKYDFSTPEAALRSQLRILMNADAQAKAEYEAKLDRRRVREKMDTLQIRRTEPFEKKQVLFVAYKREDKEVKAVEWYEKDEKTGLWKPTFESVDKVRATNRALADAIQSWVTRDDGPGGFADW